MANEGGEKRPFTLPAHASSTVALHDYFYLVANDDYAIISPDGTILKKEMATSTPLSTAVFGTFLRINRVWRLNDTICFGYFWLHGEYPRGWLKYELGVGFNGRCPLSHN